MAGTLHNWGAGQRVGGAQSPGHIKLFFLIFLSLKKKWKIYGHALARRFLFVSISSFPKDFNWNLLYGFRTAPCWLIIIPDQLFLSSRKIIVLTKEPSNGPADHVINRPLMITPIQWNHFYRFLITVALHSSPRDDASQGKFHFKFLKIKISLDVYVPLQRHNVTGLRGEMWFWVVSGGPDHSGHLSVPSAVFAHRSPGSEELGGGWPAGKPIPLRFHHRPTTISLDCLFVLGRYPLSSLSSCFISSNLNAGCTLQLKFN